MRRGRKATGQAALDSRAPEGSEATTGCSVFFDEIGEMSPYAQAKILRAIERKEVERVGGKRGISLEDRFRKDLYFRLHVARIHMPPLRDRKEDIPLLLDRSIRELNRRFGREVDGFTAEACDALLRYDWPGNVRELRPRPRRDRRRFPALLLRGPDRARPFPPHPRGHGRVRRAGPRRSRLPAGDVRHDVNTWFDFPLTDNTLLPDGNRFALALSSVGPVHHTNYFEQEETVRFIRQVLQ